MQVPLIIEVIPNPSVPTQVANAAATSILNELVVLSFGAVEPLKPGTEAEGQPTRLEAPVVARVAIPASAFGSFLAGAMSLIKGLPQPQRDQYGWTKVAEVVSKAAAEGE